MSKGIDCDVDVTNYAGALVRAGYTFVLRYINSSKAQPLTLGEAAHCSQQGLYIGSLFENGFPTSDAYFTTQQALSDVLDAANAVRVSRQPVKCPVYFAVDYDALATEVMDYFNVLHDSDFHANIGYPIGVYGSGDVCRALLEAGLVSYTYLAYPLGWSGTADLLASGLWNIHQTSNDSTLFDGALSVDEAESAGNSGCWQVPPTAA